MFFHEELSMSFVFRINSLHFYYLLLSKTRASQRRASQSTENNTRPSDPWSEIDRRNQRVLYPLNAKDSYGAANHLSRFNYQKNKLSSNSFNLESYNSSDCHRCSSPQNDENLLDDSSIFFQKFYEKRTPLPLNNNSSSYLYGNSIIKSNKADILSILEQQQSITGANSNNYVNKHGIIISEDGPFWPRDFRILHPTPKLLIRQLTPKEFYLTVNNSSLLSK